MAAAIIAAVLFWGWLNALTQSQELVRSPRDRELDLWPRERRWVTRSPEIGPKDASAKCFEIIKTSSRMATI